MKVLFLTTSHGKKLIHLNLTTNKLTLEIHVHCYTIMFIQLSIHCNVHYVHVQACEGNGWLSHHHHQYIAYCTQAMDLEELQLAM